MRPLRTAAQWLGPDGDASCVDRRAEYRCFGAAVNRWPEGFTIRKLALQLKVVPTTIRAHVKGGIGELRREVARRVLADLTRPYQAEPGPQ